jgi:hypothetical protein
MATACPKGKFVHQVERYKVQFPPLQLPEGCTHGFAVGETLSSPFGARGPKKDGSGVRGNELCEPLEVQRGLCCVPLVIEYCGVPSGGQHT